MLNKHPGKFLIYIHLKENLIFGFNSWITEFHVQMVKRKTLPFSESSMQGSLSAVKYHCGLILSSHINTLQNVCNMIIHH